MTAASDNEFFRNDVLTRDDGTSHRLLRVDVDAESANDGWAWVILLGAPLALPRKLPLADLHSHFKRFEPVQTQPEPAKSELFSTVSKAHHRPPSKASLAVSERAFARIAPLVDQPGIFEPDQRHALLLERSKQPGAGTPKTLLKDLRRWWQGGQTQDALLGDYRNSGRPQATGTAGRGRHKVRLVDPDDQDEASVDEPADSQRPYQLTQVDLDKMKAVIEDYYFDKQVRRTLTATLQHLHERHYTYVDGNGAKHLRPLQECPSYRQLDHFLKCTYPLEVRETARKGKKRFALEDRSTQGSIQTECHGAGHIYEFDATIVDVPLVSSKVRSDIIGKPTLYLIIDRFTRLIVGWYIGFENACYSAAMQAILSIGADKEELCRRLDIPYDPADWPAHAVLPEMFLADQGELMHKKARRIARSLRSTLSNVPGMRPDWKPLVECGFAMLHQIIAPDTPGYSPDSEAKRRRSVNRDKNIALNLEEFTRVIVCAIIAHNKTMQRGYPLSLQQAADGVQPIPRKLWSHSVRKRMGLLDRMDFTKVREELMPRDTATVTEDGILFGKVHYSCPEAERRGWLVEGRRRRKPLDVAFDYRLVDEIVVYAPDGCGESFVATLTKDSCMFAGMSTMEVERHFERVAALTGGATEVKRQARFEYHQRTKPTIDNAKAETQSAVKGSSRASRYANAGVARNSQLQSERQSSAGVRPAQKDVGPVEQPSLQAHPRPSERVSAQVISLHHAARDPQKTPHVAEEQPVESADKTSSLKQRMAQARLDMLS